MIERVSKRLRERAARGISDLPEAEIESIARIVASEAKVACGNAVGEAYQLGVNSTATPDDHKRPTLRGDGT